MLDVETTGLDPEKDQVVELAAVLVPTKDKKSITIRRSTLIDPGMVIPPDAMGIHHISNKDVKGKPKIEEALLSVLGREAFIPAAHNAGFDSKFLPSIMEEWICTWRCSKHIWPDAPSFSNQTLRYYLELFDEPEEMAMPPHRAGPDAWVSAHIVCKMLEKHSTQELLDLTKKPILLKTVNFGKHRGEEWSKVPRDYLKWILKGDPKQWDPDVIHTVKVYA